MGINPGAANAFTNNFIAGYSFVDSIKRNKRNEQRLEERLTAEKEARAFTKRRIQEQDSQVRQDRALALEDRKRGAADREKRLQGDKIAANPNSTVEELTPFVSFSPNAARRIQELNKQARITNAVNTVADLRDQGLSNQVAQQQGAQLPSDIADPAAITAQEPLPPVDEATRTRLPNEPGRFDIAPDRGLSSLVEQDIDATNVFRTSFKKKGFVGRVAEKIAGQGSEIVRGLEDVVSGVVTGGEAVLSAITGTERKTSPQNVGQEFGGNIFLDNARFTTPEEFTELEDTGASQAEIAAAERENTKLIDEMEERGRQPRSFSLDAISDQGAVFEGADLTRQDAENAQRAAIAEADRFLDPGFTSRIEAMAERNPRAASAEYLNIRATLKGAAPNTTARMDRRMISVLDVAEAGFANDIAELGPESPGGRRAARSLENLHRSRNQIASEHPSIATTANINSSGLKPADVERVDAVMDEIFNPERPVRATHEPGPLRSASTVVGRIKPGGKRLNDKQIQAVATLLEYGHMDRPTANSLFMGDGFPPGKDPNAIAKLQAAGGRVYALLNNGAYTVLPSAADTAPGSREIGNDQIKWMLEGAKTWGLSESRTNQAIGMMSDFAPYIRAHYNTESQEGMLAAGRALGQSAYLSAQETLKNAEEAKGFFWDSEPERAPSPEEIFLNQDMRIKLAEEYEVRPVPMPAGLTNQTGLDTDPVLQSLLEGKAGPELKAKAKAGQLTQDDLVVIFITLEATPEEIAAFKRGIGL